MDGRISKATELMRKASNMLLESQGSSGGRYPGRPTVKTWATQEPWSFPNPPTNGRQPIAIAPARLNKSILGVNHTH